MRASRHEFPQATNALRLQATQPESSGGCVDPAPAPVAPRQVPSRPGRQCLRHKIEARCAEWMAAQQPRKRHPSAGPQAKAFERLVAVDRAGRKMTAIIADQRREGVAIK